MRIVIKRIEIQNFRSIQKKAVLELKPGLFAIEGINYTEQGSTNAAGKTSIISALFWALTGNALNNDLLADEIVNMHTGKNCRVSVFMTVGNDEIEITRTRKDSEVGNNLFFIMNGQDLSCHKIADTQNRIYSIIKIPMNLLRSTVIMTSSMESAFTSLTPQQRISTLENIRDYTIWDKVRDEANKDSKEYNTQINKNNLDISNLIGSVNTYSKLITTLQVEHSNLQSNSTVEQIDIAIEKTKKEKINCEAQIKIKKEEIANFDNTTIDTTDIVAKMSDITTEVSNIKLKVQQEKNIIDKKQQSINYDLKDVERELSVIDKWFTNDTCPTCGKKLDRTENEINEKTIQKNAFLNKKSDLNKEKEALNTQAIDDLEKEAENKIAEKRVEYKELQLELERARVVQQEKTSKYSTLQNELSVLQSECLDAELAIKELITKKETQQAEVIKREEDIKKYNNEVLNLEKDIQELKDINKTLEEKKSLSDFYYKLLGSKGELRPYLLNKDIVYLNNRMQFYISRFFKNTEVSLFLNNAAIEIKVVADGITKNISSLSGGEKKRVNISIQLALYDLIQTVSQCNFNMLCLDEIESELDPLGCEQLIEIIGDKSESIDTVWWITNNNTVKENILNKIIVKKIQGKTEIEEM